MAVSVSIPADFLPLPASLDATKSANLRYVSDRVPGIRRRCHGHRFAYFDEQGNRVTDEPTLARIKSLAIPPAWIQVWISPFANGHIQATGRDSRGRKQYRYHNRWRSVRDETKYAHVLQFAESLSAIRHQVEKDLKLPGLPRRKVIAAVVRLMELTLARVGNAEYAKRNHSFGITTLRNRHVHISRGRIELDFNAKSNVPHHSIVSDRKLARILKNCRDLPGSELFQYVDEVGNRHSVDSGDLNEYLRSASGRDISAKDFRTWAATNLALMEFAKLADLPPSKKKEVLVINKVASELGNTPAVCRKCYIHPAVINSYRAGRLKLPRVRTVDESQIPDVWMVETRTLRQLTRELAAGIQPRRLCNRTAVRLSGRSKERARRSRP